MKKEEKTQRCRARVDDKYSEQSRPCMRKVGKDKLYCWQHSSAISRIHKGLNRIQGARGW